MNMFNFPYLPDEIILNICSRLPAKSIGHCRCVSKPWRAWLSTPQFIKNHLTHVRKSSYQSTLFITNSRTFSCSSFSNAHHLFDEITASKYHLFGPDLGSCTRVFNSCDGLLLVSDHNHKLVLINPILREITEVRNVSRDRIPNASDPIYGLGYDSVDDDYKVVAISYGSTPYSKELNRVLVYSVNTGAWKLCETSMYVTGFVIDCSSYGVFLGHCIHWLARRTMDDSLVIAAFNVEEEKLYEMPLPSSYDCRDAWCHFLGVLSGCLCIYSNHFDVWTMKAYGVKESWVKLVTFEPKGAWFWPLCLTGRENLVLRKFGRNTNVSKLVSYNLKERIFKDVVVKGIGDNNFTVWRTFVDTLASPHCHIKMG